MPVLSVHRTDMAPRSWIEASRLTITLRPAMRIAPRESVTVVIIGSSSGVRPTASATANSSESSTGRPNTTRMASTTTTRARVSRAITRPNSRRSRSNGEGPSACAKADAAAPNTVSRPVLTASAIASPVCATEPRNSAFEVSSESAAAPVAGCFCDRIGLAGQRRFACRESGAFEDQGIGRDDIAGPDAKHVSGNDRLHLDLPEHAVAPDFGLERHRPPQDFRGSHRVSFLHGIEPDRERQDEDDDRAADLVAGQHRNDAGGQQNQGKRFEQAAEHRPQQAVGPGRRIAVGAILIEPPRGLVGAQPLRPAVQRCTDFPRRKLPEGVLGQLQTIRQTIHQGTPPKYSCS